MSVNNESKPSATPLLPHTMLLLAGTFRSTLNGGGGGLEFYTNNRFARSSPVFNTFLNTFVPDCRVVCCVFKSQPYPATRLRGPGNHPTGVYGIWKKYSKFSVVGA